MTISDLTLKEIENAPVEIQNLLNSIHEENKECELILNRNNFYLQNSKTRFMTGKGAKIITGLRINQDKPSIGCLRKKQLRATLHNLIIKKNDSIDRYWIVGMLSFLRDIEPDIYQGFTVYIKKLKSESSGVLDE